MNPRVEKLLQPVSPEQPCGPDVSYDPRFEELETILKGKPEIEVGSVLRPAEPPDWSQLLPKSVEFLAVGKHLRAAVMFTCAALKVEGFPGLRDGLQLIRALITNHWDNVHPLLDPEDNNDPQQRLSILSSLTAPRNSTTSWLQIIDTICTAPLCRPAGVPPVTLDDVLTAAAGGAPGRDAATLDAQFSSVPSEELAATRDAVAAAIEATQGIDGTLQSILGARATIGFEELLQTLRQVEKVLADRLAGAPSATAANADGAADGAGAGAGISGPVRSRADVIRAIDSICAYYRQAEPSSPVPYLLRRAQTLAGLSFVGAMQELNLASLDQLRALMGSSVDVDAPPPA